MPPTARTSLPGRLGATASTGTRILAVAILVFGLAAGRAHGANDPWETELDEFKASVRPWLDNNPGDVQAILRGLSGLEVNIYFRTDSAAIDRFSALQIYNVAQVMLVYPMVRVTISGFADVRGTPDHNMALSARRVEAVRQVLLQAGRIDPDRIYSHAYGEAPGQYGPDDREGMLYDRRASLKLIVHRPELQR